MKKEELDKILELHKKWLDDKEGGIRADLRRADLRGASLHKTNLCYIDLSYANLRGVSLCEADLHDADLCYANLNNANLHNANLRYANLRGVSLCEADLHDADLCYANLNNANLCEADLRNADLRNADLQGASLCNTNLDNIEVNYLTIGYHLSCPESSSFVGFKKLENGLIAKIEIPTEAKRSSATTRKCRAEFVKVLEITDENDKKVKEGYTLFSSIETSYIETVYEVGKITRADSWDENRWKECSNGIHFFLTKEEAMLW